MFIVPECQTTQPDHLHRKFVNFHCFAHIENKHLAAVSHAAGLDYQLGRLGDGHEIAGNIFMSHGDRTAYVDLIAEQRDDRTG